MQPQHETFLCCPVGPDRASRRVAEPMMSSQARSFLFLLSSSRRQGNTEQLARLAATTLPECIDQRWIHLIDVPLLPFTDARHAAGAFPAPHGNELVLLEATLAATDLVIAAPLYWYSAPASVKLYFDYWTAWLRLDEFSFATRMRGKTMWVVCSASSGDPAHVAPLLDALRLTADYVGMKWGGALLGNGNRPGEVFDDVATHVDAAAFFRDIFGSKTVPAVVQTCRLETA